MNKLNDDEDENDLVLYHYDFNEYRFKALFVNLEEEKRGRYIKLFDFEGIEKDIKF